MQSQKERIFKICILHIAVLYCSKARDTLPTSELTILKFVQQFAKRSERAFCESKQTSFELQRQIFSFALLIQKH
jgi:hypothetical protein